MQKIYFKSKIMTPLVTAQMSPAPTSASSSLPPSLAPPTAHFTHAHLAAMYSSPIQYPEQPYAIPTLGTDQPTFYNPAVSGLDLKETLAAGAPIAPGWPYPSVYYPYETSSLASYPFAGYGMGLDAARRKNATREATQTLKAWLNEHKKNPYPTKGEKIMLAIITKMTLTQVSTWFANARRRLKKENKMTWEPRSRTDDDDDEDDDRDDDKIDDKDDKLGKGIYSDSEKDKKESDNISVSDDTDMNSSIPPTDVVTKPRIWSLAEMATSNFNGSVSGASIGSSAGKIMAGGLSRGLHHMEAAPYARPIFNPAAYPYIPPNVSDSILSYSYGKSLGIPSIFSDTMHHSLLTAPLVQELSRHEFTRADFLRPEPLRFESSRLDKEV